MRLLYYKGSHPNFGDDLNEIVWPALAPDLFAPDPSAADSAHGFLGIGTLIGRPFPDARTIHVFSSGVGYDRIAGSTADYRYWCVRGPLTARALGLAPDRGLIDGGVFAPEVLGIAKAIVPDARPVVIPHWESLLAGGWAEACDAAGQTLVDPMQPPRNVIGQIARAPLVITESLHGAIMADVLRIPWIAIVTTANVPLFKWFDWTASVGLPLTMIPVQPPVPAALARFGRPGIGAPGRAVTIGEEQAFAHFARWGIEDKAGRPSPARIARAVAARLRERIAGVSPDSTARALRAIADGAGTLLSAPGMLDRRKAALLDRLRELGDLHAAGGLDRAPTGHANGAVR